MLFPNLLWAAFSASTTDARLSLTAAKTTAVFSRSSKPWRIVIVLKRYLIGPSCIIFIYIYITCSWNNIDSEIWFRFLVIRPTARITVVFYRRAVCSRPVCSLSLVDMLAGIRKEIPSASSCWQHIQNYLPFCAYSYTELRRNERSFRTPAFPRERKWTLLLILFVDKNFTVLWLDNYRATSVETATTSFRENIRATTIQSWDRTEIIAIPNNRKNNVLLVPFQIHHHRWYWYVHRMNGLVLFELCDSGPSVRYSIDSVHVETLEGVSFVHEITWTCLDSTRKWCLESISNNILVLFALAIQYMTCSNCTHSSYHSSHSNNCEHRDSNWSLYATKFYHQQ